MQRFFVTFPLTLLTLEISDEAIYHQVSRVLRAKPGEGLVLFNGDGREVEYKIIEITKKSIFLSREKERNPSTEPLKTITLYQALPNKMEKIEYIIEKGVEVGIRKFIFFRSDYSQKLVLSDGKKLRLHTIAQEALEQCLGVKMPEIEFSDSPAKHEGGSHNIVLDTTGSTLKLTEMPQNDEICLWIGPEGGWSEKERNKMKDNGFIFVRFGERVMRTETAGVVTAFSLLHL